MNPFGLYCLLSLAEWKHGDSQLDMHCSNLHSSQFSKPHAHLEYIQNIVQHWYWFWSSLNMCLKTGMVPHISCLRLNLDKFTFYKMHIIWSAFLSSSMWPWLSAHFIYPVCMCVCTFTCAVCVCVHGSVCNPWHCWHLSHLQLCQSLLWRRACSMHCRMFSSIHVLYLIAAGSAPSYPVVTNKNVSNWWHMSPGWQNSLYLGSSVLWSFLRIMNMFICMFL